MLALEKATENLDYALSVVRHLESVSTTPELRAAWNAVEPETSAFYSRIPLNEGLWKQLQRYADRDAAKSLSGREAAVSHQDARFVPAAWRGTGCGGQESSGGNRRGADQMDHEIFRERSRFHQRF
jgi:Zn-dependent oligopeptidase